MILDRRMKASLLAAVGASILIAFLDTVAIALILPLVDIATGSAIEDSQLKWVANTPRSLSQQDVVKVLTVVVVTLFVLKDLGAIAYSWWLAGFKSIEKVRLQTRLLRHFLDSPYTEISTRSTSELIRTLSDATTQVFGTTVFGLMGTVANTLSISAITLALLLSAPVPTLIAISCLGVASLLYIGLMKPIATNSGRMAAKAAQAGWHAAFAALGGIKEVHLRGAQSVFVNRFNEAAAHGAKAARCAEFTGGLPRHLLEILFISAVGIYLLVFTGAGGSGSTIGILALFVAAGFRVLPSVTGLLTNISQIRFGTTYLDLVHAEMQSTNRPGSKLDARQEPLSFDRELRLQGVSFRYPRVDHDVISDVSLIIPHGSSLALVGASGAGKSTLADLILGLHLPTSGRILADGVDTSERMPGWQSHTGYVPQDIFLLDATLAENIAFDQPRPSIDDTLLIEVIKCAQLEDVVAELPEGVDTPIGERGMRLSGGQRQRVGIARALYRRPKMLIFDEATAALDNETEHQVVQTIMSLRGAVTVVLVAHRLSSVRYCDQVAFMKSGRLIAAGSFESVRRQSPDFNRLVQLGRLSPRSGGAEIRRQAST